MSGRLQIAVIGAGQCTPELARSAEEIGAAVAVHGAVLVCGGLGGVMAAAAAGAKRAGGMTVGVLPTYDRATANAAIDIVLPTGMGHARNVIVVAAGDAVIALSGEHGTASEIAMALKLGRPVVALDSWGHMPGVVVAGSPAEVVEEAVARARRRRGVTVGTRRPEPQKRG